MGLYILARIQCYKNAPGPETSKCTRPGVDERHNLRDPRLWELRRPGCEDIHI
jgi:hypothetical protein